MLCQQGSPMASQTASTAVCPSIKGGDHTVQPVLRPLLQVKTDKCEQAKGRITVVGSWSTCCAKQLRESGLFGLEQRQVWRPPIQPVCLANRWSPGSSVVHSCQVWGNWVTASISTTSERFFQNEFSLQTWGFWRARWWSPEQPSLILHLPSRCRFE